MNSIKKILYIAAFICTISITSATAEQKLELSGNDTMRFDKSSFEVAVGEPVTLVFTNVGKLPKAAMGHNVVILKSGTDVAQFAAAAMNDAKNDYIPTEKEWAAKIVANSKVLGPGETDTITFSLEKGSYTYICSFPGHYAIMKGTITAK